MLLANGRSTTYSTVPYGTVQHRRKLVRGLSGPLPSARRHFPPSPCPSPSFSWRSNLEGVGSPTPQSRSSPVLSVQYSALRCPVRPIPAHRTKRCAIARRRRSQSQHQPFPSRTGQETSARPLLRIAHFPSTRGGRSAARYGTVSLFQALPRWLWAARCD